MKIVQAGKGVKLSRIPQPKISSKRPVSACRTTLRIVRLSTMPWGAPLARNMSTQLVAPQANPKAASHGSCLRSGKSPPR